jgi:hypothetical protein
VTRIYAVTFTWVDVDVVDSDGVATRRKAMVPLPRYDNIAKRQWHAGEEYTLVPLEARSRPSHNYYFAALDDAFENLPERIAARWPTAEHMRKWCLVETGWFDESEINCASPQHAIQAATLIRSFDEYARISLHGSKVIIRRAKSQSAAAMTKEPFEASKRDVLDLVASFIGTTTSELRKHAGRSA